MRRKKKTQTVDVIRSEENLEDEEEELYSGIT
jgi:hypothetical protein